MKIIYNGRPLPEHTFGCEKCGCIFTANHKEYASFGDCWWAYCPQCGKSCLVPKSSFEKDNSI